jgi:hypothetical protein
MGSARHWVGLFDLYLIELEASKDIQAYSRLFKGFKF